MATHTRTTCDACNQEFIPGDTMTISGRAISELTGGVMANHAVATSFIGLTEIGTCIPSDDKIASRESLQKQIINRIDNSPKGGFEIKITADADLCRDCLVKIVAGDELELDGNIYSAKKYYQPSHSIQKTQVAVERINQEKQIEQDAADDAALAANIPVA